MKKLFSFLITAVFMMCLLITPASAADMAKVSGSNEETTAGSEVTVSFSISEASFASYEMQITGYDTSVLKLVNIQRGAATLGYFDFNDSLNGKVAGADSGDSKVSGVLFTATFEVNANAKCGTYPVGIYVDYVADIATNDLTIEPVNGSVTIKHNYKLTSSTPATCEGEGKNVYTCSNCGHSYTEKINPIGHSWDEGKVTTEANCTTEGVKTFTCKNDKTHTYTEKIPVNGVHSYDNGVVTTPATCDKDGVMTFTCKHDPSHTYTKSIKALGHKWDEGKVTTKPTCTENGVMTYTCLNDPSHTYTEVIPAHGHDWSDWEPLKKPTETEWGLDQRTCRICGCTETRDVAPAKDQVPDTGVRSNNYAAWIAVAAVAGVAVVTVARKRKTAK